MKRRTRRAAFFLLGLFTAAAFALGQSQNGRDRAFLPLDLPRGAHIVRTVDLGRLSPVKRVLNPGCTVSLRLQTDARALRCSAAGGEAPQIERFLSQSGKKGAWANAEDVLLRADRRTGRVPLTVELRVPRDFSAGDVVLRFTDGGEPYAALTLRVENSGASGT